ncbi:MAG: FimV/HubP family polar landmark protein, partial [Burkholderiaceae bacterium]
VEDSGPAAGTGDQLRLSRSQGAAAAAAGGSAGTRGASSAETQVARDAAVREQQERIAALEKNVADLQQLVELKNRQMAELQRQVEAARAAGASAAGTIAAPSASGAVPAPGAAGAPAPSATAPATAPPASSAASSTATAPGAQQPSAAGSPSAPAAPAATTPEPSAAPSAAAPASEPAAPVAAAPAPAPAQPTPAPAAEPGLLDGVLSNPLTLPAVAAVALALGLYGLFAMRRRRKTEKFEDSLSAADAFTANSLFGSTGGQAVDTNNSLFASNIRDSGVDVHSTEVDPIAEAEVYIAYGREAQAEEILKEALKKQPDRQAIRLKLLEIYAGRKDVLAFGAVAQEMYDMAGGQNEEWPKVVTLGLSIDPANPLYTGHGDVPAADSGAALADAGAAPASDAPKAEGSGGAAAGLTAAATAAALVLGDRMRAGETERLPSGELASPLPSTFAETVPMDGEKPAAVEEMPALDFNLDIDTMVGRAGSRLGADAADAPSAGSDESELARAIDGRFELPSLDLDLDLSKDAAPVEALQPDDEPPALADLGDFKIDLPSLEEIDNSPSAVAAAPMGSGGETPAIDMGGEELGLAVSDGEPAPSVDSPRWQEMATKLDLASAYEEIGDKEGARELLEEVIKGGDVGQQQKARTMLSKIG